MTDHYDVLGVSSSASQEEIQSAFEACLADRRARRRASADLHAAFAVVGDPAMRRAYDLARVGVAASEQLTDARDAIADRVSELIAQIDVQEVASEAKDLSLKVIVVASGLTAKAADFTGSWARRVQLAAAKTLDKS